MACVLLLTHGCMTVTRGSVRGAVSRHPPHYTRRHSHARTAPTLFQQRVGGAARVHHAVQVGCKHVPPRVLAHVLRGAVVTQDGGIRYQNVQLGVQAVGDVQGEEVGV